MLMDSPKPQAHGGGRHTSCPAPTAPVAAPTPRLHGTGRRRGPRSTTIDVHVQEQHQRHDSDRLLRQNLQYHCVLASFPLVLPTLPLQNLRSARCERCVKGDRAESLGRSAHSTRHERRGR